MHAPVAERTVQCLSSKPLSSVSGAAGTLSVHVPQRPPRGASTSAHGPPSPACRYNLLKDVVVRGEIASEGEIRQLLRVIYASVGLGFVALLCLCGLKLDMRLESVRAGELYTRANAFVALVDTVAMSVATGCYFHRVADVTRRGFRWSFRRKRQVWLFGAQFATQSVNSLFYLLPNAAVVYDMELIAKDAFKYLGVVRYTMWNNIFLLFLLRSRLLNLWLDRNGEPVGGRPDSILADGSLKKHWWMFCIWLLYEALLVAGLARAPKIHPQLHQREASSRDILCNVTAKSKIVMGHLNVILVVYHALGIGFIYHGYKQLTKKPYNLFRATNLGLRYHLLISGTVGHLLTLSFVLLFWVRYDSCGTGILTWFGSMPAQFVMTVMSVAMCIFFMPVKPGREVSLDCSTSAVLVWRESWKASTMKWGNTRQGEVQLESHLHPFCFETSLKLWYWSLAVYGYDPVTEQCFDPKYPRMSLEVAMRMYNLKHFKHIQEKICDTNVLVAWNDNTVLVCFRGTYSASNIWADLQFWRVVHTPKRGRYVTRSRPLVHKGFMKSWTTSNLNHTILNRVIRIMHSDGFDKANARVLVTGHSLGGALAVLASYDIATHCGIGGERITCYTFGAPRVGNHAFAQEFDVLVPNTWQVINDKDIIPRMPKFLILFKHVGGKVIVNGAGDLIVKPNLVEVSLYTMFTFFDRSSSVGQHLLLSYRKSFVAICEAQFIRGKALKGGMDAVLSSLEDQDRLLSAALDLNAEKLQGLCFVGASIWRQNSPTGRWVTKWKGIRREHLMKLKAVLCLGKSTSPSSDSATSDSSIPSTNCATGNSSISELPSEARVEEEGEAVV